MVYPSVVRFGPGRTAIGLFQAGQPDASTCTDVHCLITISSRPMETEHNCFEKSLYKIVSFGFSRVAWQWLSMHLGRVVFTAPRADEWDEFVQNTFRCRCDRCPHLHAPRCFHMGNHSKEISCVCTSVLRVRLNVVLWRRLLIFLSVG